MKYYTFYNKSFKQALPINTIYKHVPFILYILTVVSCNPGIDHLNGEQYFINY